MSFQNTVAKGFKDAQLTTTMDCLDVSTQKGLINGLGITISASIELLVLNVSAPGWWR